MKEKWIKIFFMMLTVVIFTGCGVKNTEREKSSRKAISGGAVSSGVVSDSAVSEGAISGSIVSEGTISEGAISGDAISGSVVSGKDVEAGHIGQSFFENDDNWYDWQDGEEDDYAALIQYRLDKKTKVREIKMDIEQVEWVSNDWLYYSAGNENKRDKYNDILWRIPIRKTKNGDRLLIKKKEKVMKADNIWVSYATDSYVIMETIGEEDDAEAEIYKYDLRTKKKTKLMPNEGALDFLDLRGRYIDDQKITWQQNYCFMIDGELIVQSPDKLYRLNPETGRATAIFSKTETEDIEYVFYQGEFYFENDSALYHYNKDSKKAECIISKKKMMKAVGELKLAEIKELTLRDIVPYKGKVYLPFKVQWKEKDSETGKETICERDELFYIKMGQPDKLFCENKLNDYLDEDGEYEEYKTEKGVSYLAYSYKYKEFEGKMAVFEYMVYSEEEENFEKTGSYVGYDITTKKGRELDEEEYEAEDEDD